MKQALAALISLVFFISCSRHGIVGSQAYVRESIAGTVRVDDNGKQLNSGVSKQHLIYIETKGSGPLPTWQTAWIDQQPYSVQAVEITNPDQVIGKTPEGNDAVVHAKPGNKLWQLVVTPKQEAVEDAALQTKINESKIVLVGTWKDKPFSYTISEEEPLQVLQMQ